MITASQTFELLEKHLIFETNPHSLFIMALKATMTQGLCTLDVMRQLPGEQLQHLIFT